MRYVYVHVSRGRERWEKGVAWVSATVGSRTVARGGKRRHATCPYLLVVWPRIAAVVAQRPEEFTLQAAGATATATTATASTAAAGGGGSSHSKGGLHDRRQIELWWHVERRIARVCLVLPHAREREKRALHADGGEERRRRSEGGMRESHEGVRAAAVELDAAGVAAYVAKHGLDRHVPPSGQAAAGASFLQVASKALAKVGVIANGCEICNYVMENKQMHQPFLCRGLKDPAQQQTVRIALPSTPPSFSVLPRFFHVYWLVIFFLFSCLYACSYPSLRPALAHILPPRPPRPSALIPITPTHPLPYPRSLIILILILILSLSLRTRPVVR